MAEHNSQQASSQSEQKMSRLAITAPPYRSPYSSRVAITMPLSVGNNGCISAQSEASNLLELSTRKSIVPLPVAEPVMSSVRQFIDQQAKVMVVVPRYQPDQPRASKECGLPGKLEQLPSSDMGDLDRSASPISDAPENRCTEANDDIQSAPQNKRKRVLHPTAHERALNQKGEDVTHHVPALSFDATKSEEDLASLLLLHGAKRRKVAAPRFVPGPPVNNGTLVSYGSMAKIIEQRSETKPSKELDQKTTSDQTPRDSLRQWLGNNQASIHEAYAPEGDNKQQQRYLKPDPKLQNMSGIMPTVRVRLDSQVRSKSLARDPTRATDTSGRAIFHGIEGFKEMLRLGARHKVQFNDIAPRSSNNLASLNEKDASDLQEAKRQMDLAQAHVKHQIGKQKALEQQNLDMLRQQFQIQRLQLLNDMHRARQLQTLGNVATTYAENVSSEAQCLAASTSNSSPTSRGKDDLSLREHRLQATPVTIENLKKHNRNATNLQHNSAIHSHDEERDDSQQLTEHDNRHKANANDNKNVANHDKNLKFAGSSVDCPLVLDPEFQTVASTTEPSITKALPSTSPGDEIDAMICQADGSIQFSLDGLQNELLVAQSALRATSPHTKQMLNTASQTHSNRTEASINQPVCRQSLDAANTCSRSLNHEKGNLDNRINTSESSSQITEFQRTFERAKSRDKTQYVPNLKRKLANSQDPQPDIACTRTPDLPLTTAEQDDMTAKRQRLQQADQQCRTSNPINIRRFAKNAAIDIAVQLDMEASTCDQILHERRLEHNQKLSVIPEEVSAESRWRRAYMKLCTDTHMHIHFDQTKCLDLDEPITRIDFTRMFPPRGWGVSSFNWRAEALKRCAYSPYEAKDYAEQTIALINAKEQGNTPKGDSSIFAINSMGIFRKPVTVDSRVNELVISRPHAIGNTSQISHRNHSVITTVQKPRTNSENANDWTTCRGSTSALAGDLPLSNTGPMSQEIYDRFDDLAGLVGV